MARISIAQQKILDRFKPGVKLALDPKTGRYAFDDGEKLKHVDQRPIDVMLRIGLLEKDPVGRCYPIAPQPSKSCYTCKHIENNGINEPGEISGWVCANGKRDPKTIEGERQFDKNFASEAYRTRFKRCYEAPLG